MIHLLPGPLGPLTAAIDRQGRLVYLGFEANEPRPRLLASVLARLDLSADPGLLEPVRQQLHAYFAGDLKVFQLPLALHGTPFQARVWAELQRIPFGATLSYGELAQRLGDPKLTRAVGAANGANPVSIIVPCHRVIGADGSLTGYAGGLAIKGALLDLEREPGPYGWL
jgi:O-6-methylguanine DNA methyltransferase